jgi:hypothetical protein
VQPLDIVAMTGNSDCKRGAADTCSKATLPSSFSGFSLRAWLHVFCGLARNAKEYKANLMACDLSRRNDLDGRGALSEEALAEFSRFFLDVCLDQIEFMEALMRPRELRARMMSWAGDEIRLKRMHEKTKLVLDHILFNGQLERKDLPRIVGMDDRQARRVAQPLVEAGLIRAATSRAAYRLAFPATLAARLMPGLYPVSG